MKPIKQANNTTWAQINPFLWETDEDKKGQNKHAATLRIYTQNYS